jgi:hypothetical protein
MTRLMPVRSANCSSAAVPCTFTRQMSARRVVDRSQAQCTSVFRKKLARARNSPRLLREAGQRQ